jgi:hypothetical protein
VAARSTSASFCKHIDTASLYNQPLLSLYCDFRAGAQ